MPSTFLSLHYHVTFSTKNRLPLLAAEWRSKVHEYLSGTLAGLQAFPEGCGGVADHVHLLFGLKATHCLADVMRELKKASTFWIQETMKLPKFSWQEGYAAFTVSPTSRPSVRRYIANQEEHHRQKPYLDELKSMLRRAKVRFEDKYLD